MEFYVSLAKQSDTPISAAGTVALGDYASGSGGSGSSGVGAPLAPTPKASLTRPAARTLKAESSCPEDEAAEKIAQTTKAFVIKKMYFII